jgi:TonB family protein
VTAGSRVAAGLAAAVAAGFGFTAGLAPLPARAAPAPINLSSLPAEQLGHNRPPGRRLLYGLQARSDVLIRGIRARPRLCVECMDSVSFLTFEIPVPAESAGVRVERLALSGYIAAFASKDPRHVVPLFREEFTWQPDTLRGVWRVPDSSGWITRIEDATTLEIPIAEGAAPMRFDLDTFLEQRAAAGGRCRREPQPGAFDSTITPPEPEKRSPPRYPEEAVALGIEGIVLVEGRVSTEGKVVEARVVLSLPPLDEVAIKAARRTRLIPARKGDEPVEVWVAHPYVFRIEDR